MDLLSAHPGRVGFLWASHRWAMPGGEAQPTLEVFDIPGDWPEPLVIALPVADLGARTITLYRVTPLYAAWVLRATKRMGEIIDRDKNPDGYRAYLAMESHATCVAAWANQNFGWEAMGAAKLRADWKPLKPASDEPVLFDLPPGTKKLGGWKTVGCVNKRTGKSGTQQIYDPLTYPAPAEAAAPGPGPGPAPAPGLADPESPPETVEVIVSEPVPSE